jgi:hypothetical protein
MLSPGDLLTDTDLLALDPTLEDLFGTTGLEARLAEKRRIAVLDWLGPQLEAAQFLPEQHRVRHAASKVFGFTAAAYTDETTACADDTEDDVDLSAVWATPASDALYVGYTRPYAGLFVGLTGTSVNANTATAAVSVWDGTQWAAVSSLTDTTHKTTGVSLSGGGRLTWTPPDDWVPRSLNDSTLLFWTRLMVNTAVTAGTSVNQVLPIVRSRLTYPVALYALSLLYRDAAKGRQGRWMEEAEAAQKQAEAQLGAVLPLITDEFDLDASGAVTTSEDAPGSGGTAWVMRRG